MTTINSFGTSKTRDYTGVRVKDVLSKCGVNVQNLGAGATLTLTSDDGYTQSYSREIILSDKTLLAWKEDAQTLAALRMCPGGETDTNMYVKGVVSITLN